MEFLYIILACQVVLPLVIEVFVVVSLVCRVLYYFPWFVDSALPQFLQNFSRQTGKDVTSSFHNNLPLYVYLVMHKDKSVLDSTREIIYLSFIWNSEDVTATLSEEKQSKIKLLVSLYKKRNLAQLGS